MSVIEGLRNFIHQEIQRALDRRMRRIPCIVDAYNPGLHAVKVRLQPQDTLTGWVQIQTLQVGLMLAPSVGDPGWLEFHEADRRAAVFVGSNHNDSVPPPQQIAAGEGFYKNPAGGQSIYFKKDGSITATDSAGASLKLANGVITSTDKSGSTAVLDGNGGIALTPSGGTVTVNGSLSVTQTFSVQNSQGVIRPCQITGNINLSGMLTATGDVVGNGHSLSTHVHADPQGGDTGPAIG